MSTHRRKFTYGQKRFILDQASELGVNRVLREHKISYSVFARWKRQCIADDTYWNSNLTQCKVDELEKENNRLKKIIANLFLNLELKSEELKKLAS